MDYTLEWKWIKNLEDDYGADSKNTDDEYINEDMGKNVIENNEVLVDENRENGQEYEKNGSEDCDFE